MVCGAANACWLALAPMRLGASGAGAGACIVFLTAGFLIACPGVSCVVARVLATRAPPCLISMPPSIDKHPDNLLRLHSSSAANLRRMRHLAALTQSLLQQLRLPEDPGSIAHPRHAQSAELLVREPRNALTVDTLPYHRLLARLHQPEIACTYP